MIFIVTDCSAKEKLIRNKFIWIAEVDEHEAMKMADLHVVCRNTF